MALMKAAKLFGPRDTRVVEVERPEPGPGEILLRVKAIAICPSDSRLWEDGHASGTYPDHPYTQGHEFSGEVAELGQGVAGPPVGTPVAVTPLWTCGECDLCRDGMTNVCRNIVFPSFPQANGVMAEFMVTPAWAVEPLPDGVGFVEGALVEPLQASAHGVGLASLRPDQPVAVVGAGIIGLGVLQIVRARGVSTVYVADPLQENRQVAEALGATKTVPFATDLLGAVPEPSQQPQVAFECSGHPAAMGQAMEALRPSGLLVIIGVPHPDVIQFDTRVPRRNELHFVFSRRYKRETLGEAVGLVADGSVDLKAYPIHTFPLDEAPEAMEFANKPHPGILRTVIEC